MPPIIKQVTCQRCTHEWYPQTPGKPKRCPKCLSRRWDGEKK